MEEIFAHNGRLVSKQEWEATIDFLRRETQDVFIGHSKDNVEKLHEILVSAIRKRIEAPDIRGKKIGVLFSGGLDSSFIAAVLKELGVNFACFTVGFQDGKTQIPLDIEAAEKVAKHLNIRLIQKVYSYGEAKKVIDETAAMLGNYANAVNVGVGSVVVAAARLAGQHNVSVLFSGLGSEEIYAGYERHLKSANIHEECWSGLKNMYLRDLIRDGILAEHLQIKVLTPLLDPAVIAFSMKFAPETKINEKGNKQLLREIAEQYLREFAFRKKKAAQYGSAFQKALERAAKGEKMLIHEYLAKFNPPSPETSTF